MKFAIAVDTRVGGRVHNEDRVGVVCTEQALLLVVADGMGGHEFGEVAAQIAVDVLSERFKRTARTRLLHPRRFLVSTIGEAHQAILDHAIRHRLSEVPSTTLVAAIVQDGTLYSAHAGDSRLYLLQDGAVQFRTRDHSHVQRLIETGFLNAKDAQTHPARNRIYNCLGAIGDPDVEVSGDLPLQPGMTMLLCSDGLWGPLQDEEIARIFVGREPQLVLPALMNVAEKRAGSQSDNLSAIAVTLLDEQSFIAGREGYVDSGELTDALSEQTWLAALMDSEMSQGLPRG